MSSRVIRAAQAVEAEPIVWRHAGGNPAHLLRGRGPRRDPAAEPNEEDRQQIELRVKAAYQQGLAAGEQAAALKAAQRVEPAIASLNSVVAELASARKKFRAEAEEDTVKLAIAIARRVLHRELSADPEAILGVVKAAFQRLNARETHRLRVAPQDAALLAEHRARLEFPAALEIVPDGTLTPGSAIFETARGELDASVETQLGEIQRGFADIIRRRAH